ALLRERGECDAATALFAQALEIDEANYASDHPKVLEDRRNLKETMPGFSKGVPEAVREAGQRVIAALEQEYRDYLARACSTPDQAEGGAEDGNRVREFTNRATARRR